MLLPFHAPSTLNGAYGVTRVTVETSDNCPQRDALSAGAGEFPKALGIGM